MGATRLAHTLAFAEHREYECALGRAMQLRRLGRTFSVKPSIAAQALHGDIQLKMVAADRSERTGSQASCYGDRWRCGRAS